MYCDYKVEKSGCKYKHTCQRVECGRVRIVRTAKLRSANCLAFSPEIIPIRCCRKIMNTEEIIIKSVGFGDTLERWLESIGITRESWLKFNEYKVIGGQCPILVKTPSNEHKCGCEERKNFLNRIFPYEPFRKILSKLTKRGIIR